MKSAHAKLFQLLKEFDACCKDLGVRYVATDFLAWCFGSGNSPLDGLEYAVALKEEDASAVAQRLEAVDERLITRRDDGSFWYSAKDSTLISAYRKLHGNMRLTLYVKPVKQGEGEALEYWHSATRHFALPQDPFQASEPWECFGFSIPVPSKDSGFYDVVFGERWRAIYPYSVIKNEPQVIADGTVAVETYLESVDAKQFDVIRDLFADYLKWKKDVLNPVDKEVNEYVIKLRTETQRFRLCEKYLPLKPALLKAWSRGAKKTVARELKDYTKCLKSSYVRKTTIYFDEELFNLAVEVLEQQGWPYAGELADLVPARHRKTPLSGIIGEYVL